MGEHGSNGKGNEGKDGSLGINIQSGSYKTKNWSKHKQYKKNKRSEPNILPPGFTVDLEMRELDRCLRLEVMRVWILNDGIPQ